MAVHRFKHFGKAADYCDVTQPTLSSMIQKLEDELGVKIFDRRSQPVQTTQVGLKVVQQAHEVLRRAKKLKETVEEERQSLLGTFNIGVLPTIAPYLLPGFFPQLMNDHPEMDIRVTELKTEEMKRALLQGTIDAGILAKVDGLEGFDCQTLYFEQFYAYVAKCDPLFNKDNIKSTDLPGEMLWLLDEGHCFRDQLVKFCHLKSTRRSKKAYSLGSIETFMRIVEQGKGITFIPELVIRQLNDEQKELVKTFALPVPTREIIMMTTPSFIRTRLLQMLVDRVRQSVPEPMLKLRQMQQRV